MNNDLNKEMDMFNKILDDIRSNKSVVKEKTSLYCDKCERDVAATHDGGDFGQCEECGKIIEEGKITNEEIDVKFLVAKAREITGPAVIQAMEVVFEAREDIIKLAENYANAEPRTIIFKQFNISMEDLQDRTQSQKLSLTDKENFEDGEEDEDEFI